MYPKHGTHVYVPCLCTTTRDLCIVIDQKVRCKRSPLLFEVRTAYTVYRVYSRGFFRNSYALHFEWPPTICLEVNSLSNRLGFQCSLVRQNLLSKLRSAVG